MFGEKTLSKEKQDDNEDELIRIMHERFLYGKDSNFFKYEEVDNNEFS